MKRAPRTTITWRFENPMAPDSKNYMPCPALVAELVIVTATLFRGKATMVAWFTSLAKEAILRYFMSSQPSGQEFRQKVDASNLGGFRNGDSFRVQLDFDCKKGVDFTHTACEKFIALCDALGNPEYRKRFYLPYPEISQVTMVEAYAENNWVEYGEYMWERFFAPKADAAAVEHLRGGLGR